MPYIQTITPPEPAPKFNASYERLDLNESKPVHEVKAFGQPERPAMWRKNKTLGRVGATGRKNRLRALYWRLTSEP